MDKELDLGMNLYEFNRVNMGQLPILKTKEELNGAKNVIKTFLNNKNAKYYMLLNHDNRYFTLFNFQNKDINAINTMADDVIECMENCDFNIIDINLDASGSALEVWVKDKNTEAVYMYLLFPYDFGVIEYY